MARKQTLVPDVVNRKHRTGSSKTLVPAIRAKEIGRNESCLMIVTVEDVQRGRSCFEEFHRGALEEDPPVGLIGIVAPGRAVHVNARTIKEKIVTNQEDFHR